MKNFQFGVLVLGLATTIAANAQDKPRVFVQGKGSQDVQSSGAAGGGSHWATWGSRSTIDSHDEGMEVTKDLQKNCSGVIVTLNQSNADYTVLLNRESKKNRGLLRSNSQLQVANRTGDVIGTNATHTVGNAAKDACQLIVADWQAHGHQPGAADQAQLPKPAVEQQPAQLVNASASQSQADSAAAATTNQADAVKRAKQHAACLELAKDNPSISCN